MLPQSKPRIISLAPGLFAFAGNSLLCRMALQMEPLMPEFTVQQHLEQLPCCCWRCSGWSTSPWPRKLVGRFALTAYALAFSWAYTTTSTGALVLFGAVQLCMMSYAVMNGERQGLQKIIDLHSKCGHGHLVLPGLSAPR